MADNNVQHGIDDNPSGDAEKGGVLGAVGGAVVGALAGGPVGAVVGALAGGAASAAGVAAVDRVDNDNTVSGVGSGATGSVGSGMGASGSTDALLNDPDTIVVDNRAGHEGTVTGNVPAAGTVTSTTHSVGSTVGNAAQSVGATVSGAAAGVANTVENAVPGNRIPGVQTGGVTTSGTPDTRGITEKVADAVTGDRTDDKTGRTV